MQLLKATIIKGFGTDKVIIHTDLPEACYPYNGNLTLEFNAAKGSGQQYVIENFPGIQIEMIG